MVIVDTALEKLERRGKPIRVGVVGAGYMGRSISVQLLKPPVGVRLAAIANRTISKAENAVREGGLNPVSNVSSVKQLEDVIASGHVAVTADPLLLCQASNIDVLIDAVDVETGGASAQTAPTLRSATRPEPRPSSRAFESIGENSYHRRASERGDGWR